MNPNNARLLYRSRVRHCTARANQRVPRTRPTLEYREGRIGEVDQIAWLKKSGIRRTLLGKRQVRERSFQGTAIPHPRQTNVRWRPLRSVSATCDNPRDNFPAFALVSPTCVLIEVCDNRGSRFVERDRPRRGHSVLLFKRSRQRVSYFFLLAVFKHDHSPLCLGLCEDKAMQRHQRADDVVNGCEDLNRRPAILIQPQFVQCLTETIF